MPSASETIAEDGSTIVWFEPVTITFQSAGASQPTGSTISIQSPSIHSKPSSHTTEAHGSTPTHDEWEPRLSHVLFGKTVHWQDSEDAETDHSAPTATSQFLTRVLSLVSPSSQTENWEPGSPLKSPIQSI